VERSFLAWVAASAAFMAAVLLLDRDGVVPQLVLGGATAVFVALFVRALRIEPRPILWCVAVATTGEVVLSLGWGLYAYHHALIPLPCIWAGVHLMTRGSSLSAARPRCSSLFRL